MPSLLFVPKQTPPVILSAEGAKDLLFCVMPRFLDICARLAYACQVDTIYRSDLRELNELNFARFDAKLEQRVAALDAKLEQRIAGLSAQVDQRFAEFETKLTNRLFYFWIAEAATTVGLVFGVVKLVGR